jgi:cytochrome bd-type quinol oxidase subunit 1
MVRIFAMTFGVGVVTGIVLSFEFGLGFAHFAQIADPVIGPMIALEVLTSFFLRPAFSESCSSGSAEWGQGFISSLLA